MALKTYDFKTVSVIIGGAIISGFDDTNGIAVERNEDAFSATTGADGEVTRSKNNNKAGSVTITLKQTSDSNDALMAIAALDEFGNNGVVPILIKDNSGRSIHTTAQGWVRKVPSTVYNKAAGPVTWIFDCDEIIMAVLGN